MSQLTKNVLQSMLDEDYNKDFHRYERTYGSKVQGDSPADKSQRIHDQLFKDLAKPLKGMQAALLKDISKNCYKEKHMAPTFTNQEQIDICREQKRVKHFGKFMDELNGRRDSTRFHFQDCVVDAGNDIEASVKCIRGYLSGMENDNVAMHKFTSEHFGKYC